MRENNINLLLMNKLKTLNHIEINKAKVLTVLFEKSVREIVNRKIQALESNFKEQAKFYGQNLEDYHDIYNEALSKYKEQLIQVVGKYNEFFINLQLELQEAECNQKIAITNMKKSFDVKKQVMGKAHNAKTEEYKRKMIACLEKKNNYELIIEECEKELEMCSVKMEKKINSLFSDKSSQVVKAGDGGFARFINKVKNIFTGKLKFNTYVVEPLSIELEVMEGKLPDIENNLKLDTVRFVAKMKQAKDEINKIFENSING